MRRSRNKVACVTIGKYRKRPVVIEACQWTVGNLDEVASWCSAFVLSSPDDSALYIATLEGDMRCDPNDWIIKGIKGEFYPCKPDIFEATYEEV